MNSTTQSPDRSRIALDNDSAPSGFLRGIAVFALVAPIALVVIASGASAHAPVRGQLIVDGMQAIVVTLGLCLAARALFVIAGGAATDDTETESAAA